MESSHHLPVLIGKEKMVEATTRIICRCKVIDNKIVFCTLHDHIGEMN